LRFRVEADMADDHPGDEPGSDELADAEQRRVVGK
jgi:hypothetical protein